MTSLRADLPHDLSRSFRDTFGGTAPAFTVRAPGRVNLIGEHVDYHDLPVLPVALERAVRLVARPRPDSAVQVVNLDPAHPPVRFDLESPIVPGPAGSWENYVKAAAQELRRRGIVANGIDAAVGSDLPPAAGLSSSSALVVAVGLALLEANQISLAPLELCASMARAERFVGTQGGGMDQAVCVAARAGHALRVDFSPLRMRPIPVPEEWSFVVADSGVRAEKSGGAQAAYNARVRESRAGLVRVAEHLGIPPAGLDYSALLSKRGAGPALEAVDRLLSTLDRDAAETVPLRRFRHVVGEAERVEKAEGALLSDHPEAFGRLMNASHESLSRDYEVGHPALDALVERALEAGALGARLTGAGFGGSIVALARAADAGAVADALTEVIGDEAGLVEVVPGAGARVEQL